ncbi:multidrug resistance protein mrp-7-like [Amblyomma americanum]
MITKSKLILEDVPRLTSRLRSSLESENESREFMKKTRGLRSPYLFMWLVIRHGWKEHLWSNAVTVLYYSSILMRIPVFHGLLAGSSGLSFSQSVLLLTASCVAECLVSSVYVNLTVRSQIRAQLLLQTAVFKKVTCLSAAGVSANSAGYVSSLLAVDAWAVALVTSFLSNAFVGLLCLPVTMGGLAREIGYAPMLACLVWLLVLGIACSFIEPVLDRSCRILYKYRDERLRKFTDFLLSIRPIKMSALENVFQKNLLQLRAKETDQAYRFNVLETVLDTLFSASSSVMIIAAFGTVSFTNPDAAFSAATMFSCVYMLTITDSLGTGMPHVLRMKSQAFRSCRRLVAFFAEEEHCADEDGKLHDTKVPIGEISIKNCSFAWTKRDSVVDSPTLAGISLSVKAGSLVGVVGTVGSGKSSLLSAISGDMRRLGGCFARNGTIGVVPQGHHIMNMTIRDNITFGKKFDEVYYDNVLNACQLARDISRMPAGDLTEAGEKGEMLSGGQKQRVALARAVYSRSDIYLLDDPTSSQDSRVASSIFENVIGQAGMINDKTRMLVTNNTRLPLCVYQWVLMHEKTTLSFRDLSEMKEHPGAPVMLFEEKSTSRSPKRLNSFRCGEQLLIEEEESLRVVKEEGMTLKKGFLEIVVEYFRYSGVSAPLALLCFAASAVFVVGQLLSIKAWALLRVSSSIEKSRSGQEIVQWLAVFCTGDVLFRLVGGVMLARSNRHRSLKLHASMLEKIAGSPLSFFDASPRGRIFNRFSVDLEVNDSRVFVHYKQLFQNLLFIGARLAVIGVQAPLVFGLACGTEIILVFIMWYVLPATMRGRLYESTRLSRVLQNLTETLDSVCLIRCYGVMDRFCTRFRRLYSDYLQAFNMFTYCFAFSRFLITFGGLLVVLLTVVIVVGPAHNDPEAAAASGVSLLSSITVLFAMAGVYLSSFWTAQGDAAFHRVLEYTELPLEQAVSTLRKDPFSARLFLQPYDDLWPCRGVVRFEHFSASYRPGIAEDTLKDVSFEAHAGQKLAVVGRTGAGKSSLVLALLGMIERTSGSITIDGVDICTVPLNRLRSSISVIPQDPSMFTGTLRENLDPQGCFSDEELWEVLRSVRMSDFFESISKALSFAISEKGGNLSAGQFQLVALARALLRATKILVLDEATSQMDADTEQKVQATLRESFAHCTVITIAHRIYTILDYDRVVVMGDGRVLENGGVTDLLADSSSVFRSIVLGAGIDADTKCLELLQSKAASE